MAHKKLPDEITETANAQMETSDTEVSEPEQHTYGEKSKLARTSLNAETNKWVLRLEESVW